MTDYSPPTENLPIFDSSVFLSGDQPLTYNEAKKKFLKYPNAQGTENFQDINVNGLSNFYKQVNIQSSGEPLLTLNETLNYSNKGLVMKNCAIDQSQSTNLNFVNSLNTINMLPNAGINSFGPIISAYDTSLPSYLSQYTINTGYYWDYFLNNVKTSILNTTNTLLSINIPTSFTSTSPPISSQIIPASNDSSNKIPTTSWVQTVISGTKPFVPKFVNYTDTQTGSTGYSNGPFINFNGSWAINDIVYFRITSQISYNPDGNGAYQNTGNTMGIIYFRPYYFTNGWAPSTGLKYCSNTGGSADRGNYFYLPSFNIGNTSPFCLNGGGVNAVRISTLNPGYQYEFFVSIEYLGGRTTNGIISFSNGSDTNGINNKLP